MRKMPNKGRTEKNMKRIISVLLCALMIVAVMVIPATATTSYTFPKAAETFNLTDGKDPNGVSYTIANGKATVGVNTYSDSCSSGYTGNGAVTIPEYVKDSKGTYPVTAVGRNAFNGSAVTSVVIGNNVETIGEMAFAGCEELTNVVFGEKVKTVSGLAFWHCSRLASVTLGAVQTIGSAAFWDCVSLAEVTIPTTCTTIMEKAFWNCSNLAMANMLDHCPAIGDKAFEGCKNGFKIGHSAGAASAFSGAGYALTETAAHAVIPTVYAEAGSTAIIAVNIEANDGMLTNTDATISLGSVTKVANIGHSYNGLYAYAAVSVGTGESGSKTISATVAGKTVSGTLVICDHKNTTTVITKSADCYNEGSSEIVCADCHKVIETKTVAKLDHKYRDFTKDADCNDDGYTVHRCEFCHDKYTDAVVKAFGHKWGSGKIVTKSTLTTHGKKDVKCDTCGREETHVLPFLADVDSDDTVGMKDLICFIRFLNNWSDISFCEDVADLNNDSKIDTKDLIYLICHLSGWENVIK